MTKVRAAAGGGRVVEVARGRITGWIGRFASRNGGVVAIEANLSAIALTAANGTRATLAVPFPPMTVAPGTDPAAASGPAASDPAATPGPEPVEALLEHLGSLGTLGMILLRGGAHSVGLCRDGTVIASSTDARYLQGRTAAGGWSQQRYQRRRGNQRRESAQATAAAALRMLEPTSSQLQGLVVGGDPQMIAEVLADPRLHFLAGLPRRDFPDIPEPRRAVLDEVARRSVTVEITVRDGDATSAS